MEVVLSRIPFAVRACAVSAVAGLMALTTASAALAVDVSQPTLNRAGDARGDRGAFTSDASGDLTWNWFVYAVDDGAVDTWGNRHNGDVPVLGDFDGDGRNDPTVYRPGSPSRWFINGSSTGPRTVAFGDDGNGDVPLHGDFDGDRKADIAVARPAPDDNGPWTWFVAGSTGRQQQLQWGDSRTDVLVPANYSGDSRTDVAVRRFEGDGTTAWYVRSDNGGLTRVGWGNHSDATVTGDYDGDGRTDITVVRPMPDNTYRWFTRFGSGAQRVLNFGDVGDSPVWHDDDGDGKTDIGVFRPGFPSSRIIMLQSKLGNTNSATPRGLYLKPVQAPIQSSYLAVTNDCSLTLVCSLSGRASGRLRRLTTH